MVCSREFASREEEEARAAEFQLVHTFSLFTPPTHPPTSPPHVPTSSSARGRGTYSGRLSPGPYRRARFARAMHGGLAL